jgi:hydroxymethylbilane synthase
MNPLRIGTRGSQLALWQANHIAACLRPLSAPRPVELIEIQTSGDLDRETSLTVLGGQGVFTKEIQRALLDQRVDVAVHSLKDLPTIAFQGLTLAAVPERGPVRDAFVSRRFATFAALPRGARVASSSLRRRAQLLARRPDLQLSDIRGNVDTRLRKLTEQDLDAIILAEAGLRRLGQGEHITECLDVAWMVPAVGQGALGLECRSDDAPVRALLAQLDHAPTHAAVVAERSLLRHLGGGCQVPIGGHATLPGETLTLHGVVLLPDGSQRIEGRVSGSPAEAEGLGRNLAVQMLGRGARTILQSVGLVSPLEESAMKPLDPRILLNKTVEEAVTLCTAAGRECLLIGADGVALTLPTDSRPGRVTVQTVQGRIVVADIAGEGHAWIGVPLPEQEESR